jgi:hypothetical protein
LGVFLVLVWAVALPFYGAWWAWHGGYSWGPRLLVPLVPVSCLPVGVFFVQGTPCERACWRRPWRTRRAFALAAMLIVLGVGMQVLGVWTNVVPHYADVVGADAARYRVANFPPRYAPPLAAIRRVMHGQTEPVALLHLDDTGLPPAWTVGAPLVSVLGLVWSVWHVLVAWRCDHSAPVRV